MSIDKIARFIIETSFEKIPLEVISSAKKSILDNLGVTIAGYAEHSSSIIVDYVRYAGGQPEATVIGSGFKTNASQAALANGTMSHSLDYDDYSTTFQHATTMTLPATLALAEREGKSGKDALEAYIVGQEVGAKIGADISSPLQDIGWHSCSIVGSLAAAACAAKIMNLNDIKIKRAMGIAASEAGGLRKNFGTDTKPFHAGNAGKNGVVAALLAKQGFTANESIFEGPLGLPKVMVSREEKLLKINELGNPFDFISPGVGIKPYPSCATMHRSISAILELVRQNSIRAEDVSEIECNVPPFVMEMLVYNHPQTGYQGKFSLQYCMTAAILDAEVGLKQFTDEKVLNPKAQTLMKKVRCRTDVKGSAHPLTLPQIVTVRMRNGSKYCHQVPFPKGDPQYPLSWDDVLSKFRDCTHSLLSESDTLRIIKLVSKLESVGNITELTKLLLPKFE